MAFLTASLAQGSCSLGVAVICIGITLVAVLRKPSKPAAQSGSSLQPQAQESLPPLPKTPAKMPSAAAMRPEFAKRLAMLNNLRNELESREDSVSSFLDDYFEGSTISKSRYLQVIQNARHVLKTNSDKALQAVKLFGNANPTPERIEILDAYVKDSRDVMNGVEKVINELIKVQQSDVLNDGDKLDELLTALTTTTTHYQKQQRSH